MSITTPNLIATDPATYLKNRFQTQTAQIAIVGLGYVGLPMAIEFVHAGFSVVGIDIDPERCETLAQGRSYIADVSDADIANLFATHRFRAVSDMSVLADADAILICVPTPLRKSKDPDLTAILSA